jgi:hypothetical protein
VQTTLASTILQPDESLPLGNKGQHALFQLSAVPAIPSVGDAPLAAVTIKKVKVRDGLHAITLNPDKQVHSPVVVVVAGACQKLESYLSLALPLARHGVRVLIAGVPFQQDPTDKKMKWYSVNDQIYALKEIPSLCATQGQHEILSNLIFVPHSHGEYLVRGAIATGLKARAVVSIGPEPIFDIAAATLRVATRFPLSFIEGNCRASFGPLYRNKKFVQFMTGMDECESLTLMARDPFDHGSYRVYLQTLLPDLRQAIRARNECKDWTTIRLSGDRLFSRSSTMLNAAVLRAKKEEVPSLGHLFQFVEQRHQSPTTSTLRALHRIVYNKVLEVARSRPI